MPFRFRQRPRPWTFWSLARTFTPTPDAIVSTSSMAPTISKATGAILRHGAFDIKGTINAPNELRAAAT